MQPIIKDIILSISDDVVSNLTQSFEKTYYGKMNYSSKNTILDSDNKLLKETIGFEIAFIHVITYFLAYSMSCSHEYMHILNILDTDKLFSWFKIKDKQIDFESIVINMITNAFEQVKGRENRKITVTISQSASHLIIYFEDSGAGVPEGKEKEIFRPFETTKENGIGLGLNIVKDIVEKYHGDISVKRSETMLGAKFIVTLPKGDE